jgi:hypothetical protein
MSSPPCEEISSQPGTVLSELEPQYSPSLGGALEFQYELPVFEMGYTVEEPSALSRLVSIPESMLESESSPPLPPESVSFPPLPPESVSVGVDWLPEQPARPAAPIAPDVAMNFRRDTPLVACWSSAITRDHPVSK